MKEIHIDYETFCPEDLRKVGAYKYAEHPKAKILMCSLAETGEDPVIWIPEKYETNALYSSDRAIQLMNALGNKRNTFYAWNSEFEYVISKNHLHRHGFKAPEIENFRCVAAMSRRANLPGGLDECAYALGLKVRKDARGEDLIKHFSSMSVVKQGKGKAATTSIVRHLPQDHPEKFTAFAEYCLQDNRVEQAAHAKLKSFELEGLQLEVFLFNARMNARGIPVNPQALTNALRIIKEDAGILAGQFRELTGLNPTQGVKFLVWLKRRGYPMSNLQAGTIDEFFDEHGETFEDQDVLDALDLKTKVGFAATSKVQRMLDCACRDNMLRGLFIWHGARTARWTADKVQPHNFKRPTKLDRRDEFEDFWTKEEMQRVFGRPTTEEAYYAITAGASRKVIETLYGPPLEVISSAIRHFMHLPGVRQFGVDYAAIEARGVNWLADETHILELYREGADLYVKMAERIYGIPASSISKKSIQRFVGKQAELGCGYSMSWEAFMRLCKKFAIKIPPALAKKAVAAYRASHKRVVSLWAECEAAARRAINNHGTTFKAGSKLSFVVRRCAGMDFLFLNLPSGRSIAYPQPKIERSSITFFGKIKGKLWGRCSTYGAKLVENATQGLSADFMGFGALQAERIGINIFALIHDEALALKEFEHQKLKDLEKALSVRPPWALDFPLAVEGEERDFYSK